MLRKGALGSADDSPAGRERFLQSLVSAKGARRRPRERSSAGASRSLLPAGSGKADAVWSNTRQTATTSHNFILESRPAAAPAQAGGGGENRTMQVRLRCPGPLCCLQSRLPAPPQPCSQLLHSPPGLLQSCRARSPEHPTYAFGAPLKAPSSRCTHLRCGPHPQPRCAAAALQSLGPRLRK